MSSSKHTSSKGLSENKVVIFPLRVGVELRGNRSGYSLTGPKTVTVEQALFGQVGTTMHLQAKLSSSSFR